MKKIINILLSTLMLFNVFTVNVLAEEKVSVFITDFSMNTGDDQRIVSRSLGEYGVFDGEGKPYEGEKDDVKTGWIMSRYDINKSDLDKYKVKIKAKDGYSVDYIYYENTNVCYGKKPDYVDNPEIKTLGTDDFLNANDGVYTIDLSNIKPGDIATGDYENRIWINIDFSKPQFEPEEYSVEIDGQNYLDYKIDEHHIYVPKDGLIDFCYPENFEKFAKISKNLIIDSSVDAIKKPELFFSDGYYYKPQYEASYSFYEAVTEENNTISKGNSPIEIDGLITSLRVSDNTNDISDIYNDYYFQSKDADGKITDMQLGDAHKGLEENEYLFDNSNGVSLDYVNIETTIIAKKMIEKTEFAFLDDTSYNPSSPISVDSSSLQNEVNKLIYRQGETLQLSNDCTLNQDLILANVLNDAGESTGMNSSYDICIDLNGKTLDLGGHSIYVERNSTIHITNGTIKGNGDAVIKSYGHLYLNNVSVTNTKKGDGGDAIWNIDGSVNIYSSTDSSVINATRDGIVMKNDLFSLFSRRYNSVLFKGNIIAGRDGIVVEKHPLEMDYRISVKAYEGTESESGHNSKINAGRYGINAEDKTSIGIYGGVDTNGNVITGETAVAVSGGDLFMDGSAVYTSLGYESKTPLIEIRKKDDNKQTVLLMTSYYFVANSKGPIAQETNNDSSKTCVDEFLISAQGGVEGTLINYNNDAENLNADPFDLKENEVAKVLGGRFSKDSIDRNIDKNVYYIKQYEDGNYVVEINGEDPVEYRFTYNGDNISELKKYLENARTTDVYIESDIPNDHNLDQNYTFNIKYQKNVHFDNHTLNNVKFNIDLINDDIDHFGLMGVNGSIINTNSEIVDIISGNLHAIGNFTNKDETSESCAFYIRGGIVYTNESLAPGNVTGNIAYKIRPEKDTSVIIGGETVGTSGVAIDYIRNNNTNGHAYICEGAIVNGEANINNAVFTIAGSLVSNEDGIAASNGAIINIEKTGVVKADNDFDSDGNGVLLDGTSELTVSGTLEGYKAIYCKYTKEQSPKVTINSRAHISTTNRDSGFIMSLDGADLLNNNRVINEYFNANGGFYNKQINESQFYNINLGNNGSYRCVQYASSNSDYPYTVSYMLDGQTNIYVNETETNTIEVDYDRLENAYEYQESGDLVAIVASDSDDLDGFDENAKEVVDIHVNLVKGNNDVEVLDETSEYQFITVFVDTSKYDNNINNIATIQHRHNDVIYNIEKVEKDLGISMKNGETDVEECFYVEDDKHITIVTNKFSDFAFVAKDTAKHSRSYLLPILIAKNIVKSVIDKKPTPKPEPTPTPSPIPDPKPTPSPIPDPKPTPTPKPKDTYSIPKTGVE